MALIIHTHEEFASHIEQVVRHYKCTYLEAVTEFCKKRNLEPEVIAPYISPKMKTAMSAEGQALHLLKKRSHLSFD